MQLIKEGGKDLIASWRAGDSPHFPRENTNLKMTRNTFVESQKTPKAEFAPGHRNGLREEREKERNKKEFFGNILAPICHCYFF